MIFKILLVTLLASILVSQIFCQEQQPATKYSFASIRLTGKHICGGSFISLNAILTAAQCFYNKQGDFVYGNYTVSLGVKNETDKGLEVFTAGVFVHEKFLIRDDGYENDIAVLKLKNDVSNAQVFYFPGQLENKQNLPTTTGFGFNKILRFEEANGTYTSSPTIDITLRTMDVQIVEDEYCKAFYHVNSICTNAPIDGQDKFGICTGGAGNMIVFNNKSIGVASRLACDPDSFGVYTNVTTYKPFIEGALYAPDTKDVKYVPLS